MGKHWGGGGGGGHTCTMHNVTFLAYVDVSHKTDVPLGHPLAPDSSMLHYSNNSG